VCPAARDSGLRHKESRRRGLGKTKAGESIAVLRGGRGGPLGSRSFKLSPTGPSVGVLFLRLGRDGALLPLGRLSRLGRAAGR
jgi:hypothetical protein